MKLNLTLIEKDPVLRSRLKEAAKHSVQDFFQGREPQEEALEYVVAAFCLGESDTEFNERLKLLFEKDCTTVVEALNSFVQNHPEFTTTPETTKTETKKETTPKPRRQKILWDTSLEKIKTEAGTEEKKKKSGSKKGIANKDVLMKTVKKPVVVKAAKEAAVKAVEVEAQEHRKPINW